MKIVLVLSCIMLALTGCGVTQKRCYQLAMSHADYKFCKSMRDNGHGRPTSQENVEYKE